MADRTDAFEQLRALAYDGAERRYGTIAPVTRDRLEHELAIIGMKGFADYFLVVHDIVQHGPTHCGRGSVANSIVSLLPRHHPRRAARRRGCCSSGSSTRRARTRPTSTSTSPGTSATRSSPGSSAATPCPRAAMVANHNCLPAPRRAARGGQGARPPRRRDPRGDPADALVSATASPLDELLASHPNFRRTRPAADWQELAREAQPLVGTPRHLSLHPGGVVIVPTALTDFVPIEPAAKVLDGAPGPDGAGHPVREGRRRGRRAGQDRPAGQPLAGGDPRRDRAWCASNTGVQLDYTSQEAGRRRGHGGALPHRPDRSASSTPRSPASPAALPQESRADSFELLVLNTSIIRPASNRFIQIYLERLHGAPYEPLAPVAARHPGRDLRGDGLPGGRGQRLPRLRRHVAGPRATGSARRSQEAARASSWRRTPRSSCAGRAALGRDDASIASRSGR